MGASRAVALACIATLVAIASWAGCSDDDGSAEQLCDRFGDGRSYRATVEGFDPTDTDNALEQLRAARVQLGELHEVAPGEVRGDLNVEIDYVQALIEAMEEVGPNDPTEAVDAARRITAEHPDVQQASDRLEAWAETTC